MVTFVTELHHLFCLNIIVFKVFFTSIERCPYIWLLVGFFVQLIGHIVADLNLMLMAFSLKLNGHKPLQNHPVK